MDSPVANRRAETEAHRQLKRLALLWAQAHGFSACGLEVRLPRCRYRADVAAYRARKNHGQTTAVFECKQARCDLRRDNSSSAATRERLQTVHRRRAILEKHLRVHYPRLRICDSLFPEFDSHDFAAIGHRNYDRLMRESAALQRRLYDCTKFETLIRYRCANLFFLVLPERLFDETEIPQGWGALVESQGSLALVCKPVWQDGPPGSGLRLLERIAAAGTRRLNQHLGLTFEEILSAAISNGI